MFDHVLDSLFGFIQVAHAEPGGGFPSFLGNYPILQFFGGLSIITISVLAFFLGDRVRRRGGMSRDDALEQFFIRAAERDQKLRDDIARQLAESRRVMHERMKSVEDHTIKFQNEMTERIHQLELTIVRLSPQTKI